MQNTFLGLYKIKDIWNFPGNFFEIFVFNIHFKKVGKKLVSIKFTKMSEVNDYVNKVLWWYPQKLNFLNILAQ